MRYEVAVLVEDRVEPRERIGDVSGGEVRIARERHIEKRRRCMILEANLGRARWRPCRLARVAGEDRTAQESGRERRGEWSGEGGEGLAHALTLPSSNV